MDQFAMDVTNTPPIDDFPFDALEFDDRTLPSGSHADAKQTMDLTHDGLLEGLQFDALDFDDTTPLLVSNDETAHTAEPSMGNQSRSLNDFPDFDLSSGSLNEGQAWSDTPALTPDGPSPPSTPDDLEEAEGGVRTYDFRIEAREHVPPFATTWLDQDDSGNYDDRQLRKDMRHGRPRREMTSKRKREDAFPEGEEAGDAQTLSIVLELRSEPAKLKFAKIVYEEPAPDTPTPVKKYGGHRLRRRGSARTVNNESTSFLSSLDLTEDLLGHPYARGCRGCLKIGFHCSLLDEEETWPCHHCADDNHDCLLITPPAVKNSCERCRRLKVPCSFRSTYDQGEACQECMESGHRCYAGPAKEFIRPRIRADWNPPEDSYKIKKALRLIKNPTPIAHWDEQRFDGPSQDETLKFRKDRPLQATRKDKIKEIKTKFCHPIQFNHIDETNTQSCHFCAEPSYPILGLAQKEVSVIELKDGEGLKEVNGGHKAAGVENTRVCLQCTTERMQIIMCPQHGMTPLEERANSSADNNTALFDLLSGTTKAATKWCSICPSLAQYQCCTDSDDGSCGLMLCEYDMVLLTGVYNSNFQEMLRNVEDERSNDRMLGLRADRRLLRQDGLLVKYILWSSG